MATEQITGTVQEKPFYIDEVLKLVNDFIHNRISMSKMVELMNDKAAEHYAIKEVGDIERGADRKENNPDKKYIIMKVSIMGNKRQIMEKGLTNEQAQEAFTKYRRTRYYYYTVTEQLFGE